MEGSLRCFVYRRRGGRSTLRATPRRPAVRLGAAPPHWHIAAGDCGRNSGVGDRANEFACARLVGDRGPGDAARMASTTIAWRSISSAGTFAYASASRPCAAATARTLSDMSCLGTGSFSCSCTCFSGGPDARWHVRDLCPRPPHAEHRCSLFLLLLLLEAIEALLLALRLLAGT